MLQYRDINNCFKERRTQKLEHGKNFWTQFTFDHHPLGKNAQKMPFYNL